MCILYKAPLLRLHRPARTYATKGPGLSLNAYIGSHEKKNIGFQAFKLLKEAPQRNQDLTMVDFFSGQGALHKSFRPGRNFVKHGFAQELMGTKRLELNRVSLAHGLGPNTRSKTIRIATYARRPQLRINIDDRCGIKCNLDPRIGFMKALTLALRVKESGLVFGGPPCGSWIFINSATHRRRLDDIFGDLERAYVRNNNSRFDRFCLPFRCLPFDCAWGSGLLRLCARWALILLLCLARSVQTLTEQPGGSVMPHFPYLVHVQRMVEKVLGTKWLSTFLPCPQTFLYLV